MRTKNPLGRYKEIRRWGTWVIRLIPEQGKFRFKVRRDWYRRYTDEDDEYQHQSGLIDTPKQAILLAKTFCRN